MRNSSTRDTRGSTSREESVTVAVGNGLADGDTVTVVKDLKVKGAGGGTVSSWRWVCRRRRTHRSFASEHGVGDEAVETVELSRLPTPRLHLASTEEAPRARLHAEFSASGTCTAV